ncbi:S9 family peptidase [Steroidobacter sp.]|uniref:S9 family peptidase n=1 Tax=Steroidobacter sp. TaxID=1978227 RepID=UPI0025D5D9D2|nr:prolyl oligopeptidase family serine peptidase [Steroidobacter sp.]
MSLLSTSARLMLSVVGCLLAAAAYTAPAFTLAQVRDYAFPDNLVAAANSSHVAWTVNDKGRRNVWVATGPRFDARQLTAYDRDDGQEITNLSLSADGAHVVYVRGGEHGGSWDRSVPANPLSHPAGTRVEILSVPISGGVPRVLAEGDHPEISPNGRQVAFLKDGGIWSVPIDGSMHAQPLLNLRGEVAALQWSPQGDRLAFVSYRSSHSLIGIYTDQHTPVLWLAPTVAHDDAPRWSPDGRSVAFIRRPGSGGPPPPAMEYETGSWQIWVGDAQTGTARMLWDSGSELRDSWSGYFEWASGRIVFQSYRDGWQHLYSLPEAGGAPLLLTPGDFMVEHVALSADRRTLVFDANAGSDKDDVDRRHVYRVPIDRSQMQALSSGDGLEWSPVLTADNHAVYFTATDQRPPTLAARSLMGGAVQPFARQLVPDAYPARALLTPRRVSFRAQDGVMVSGQLFEPKGGAGQRPAVVYIHGGPSRQMLLGWHSMESYANDYVLNQYLASRGYVVLSVNYRLSIGYGHPFQFPAEAGALGAAEYRDIQAAGRYLQALPGVDPRRIGVYGGSYGGYLTAMALAHDSDLFAAGVDINGVHDWTVEYSQLLSRKRYEQPPGLKRALAVAWQSSPVSAVDQWTSPVLFIHGDDDRNVLVSQTVDMARRLQLKGVAQQTLLLVDETHSILRYANVLAVNQAIADFFERQFERRR